ncbi:MAG: lactonase family protein [Cellulosilyticaceae bacterium]
MKDLVVSGYSKEEAAGLKIGEQAFWEENPSFCAVFENRLFVLNELGEKGNVAFYEKQEGAWRLVDKKEVSGGGLCHLSYSPKHHLLFGACYGTGHIMSIEVLDAGFGEVTSLIRLEACAVDEVSRAHCVQMDTQQSYLYAVNIHTDTIWCFRIEEGKLKPNQNFEKMVLPMGSGPRHIIFNEKKSVAYVITEYSNELFVLSYDNEMGELHLIQQISTLPLGFEGKSYGATCVLTQDSQVLYAANRGDNSIVSFKVLENGCLEYSQRVSCGGEWPRHISLADEGDKLYVCNQKSHDVAVLEIDKQTGAIGQATKRLRFNEPTFVQEIKGE